MIEFVAGGIVGSLISLIADHIVTKYLAKVEAKIKTDVVAAEALKQSAETEITNIKKVL